MKKDELMKMVGQSVKVTFNDGQDYYGVLGYTKEFSAKYDYRKVGYFTVYNMDFKVSHIKKCEVI